MSQQQPAMTAAERAMLRAYDYFEALLQRNPQAAATLALHTLDLWSNAAQPQKKGRKQDEHTNRR